MKRIVLLFFCFPLLLTAQLQIKINSITTDNSDKNHRKFNIEYTLENTSDKEIAFFCSPKYFNPAHRGSQQIAMLYKIYENDTLIPADGILSNSKIDYLNFSNVSDYKERIKVWEKKMADELNITLDSLHSYQQKLSSDPDFYRKETSKILMSSLIRIPSKSSKTFQNNLYWDKKRYYKTDDNEYYLDETSQIFIEIALVALKEEFSSMLTTEDLITINNTPSIIKGYFGSNKVLLDLSN